MVHCPNRPPCGVRDAVNSDVLPPASLSSAVSRLRARDTPLLGVVPRRAPSCLPPHAVRPSPGPGPRRPAGIAPQTPQKPAHTRRNETGCVGGISIKMTAARLRPGAPPTGTSRVRTGEALGTAARPAYRRWSVGPITASAGGVLGVRVQPDTCTRDR